MLRNPVLLLLAMCMVLAFEVNLVAQEPCSGEAITVFNNDDCGKSMKIDVTDSTTICQLLCLFGKPEDPKDKCGIDPGWIGGTVQADPGAENGFVFVPATVRIAEIVAEALQTNICQIADAPDKFDGGLWYIPYAAEPVN